MTQKKPKMLTDVERGRIEAKILAGVATTKDEAVRLVNHINIMIEMLDLADEDDVFGTKGWRHRVGLD